MCKTWRLIYQCGHFINFRLSTCLGNVTVSRRGEVSNSSDACKLTDSKYQDQAVRDATRASTPPSPARVLCHSTPYLCLVSKGRCGQCMRLQMEKKLMDRIQNIRLQTGPHCDDASQAARGEDGMTNGQTTGHSLAPQIENVLEAKQYEHYKSMNGSVNQAIDALCNQQTEQDFVSRFHWQLGRAYPDHNHKNNKPRYAKPPKVESYSARIAKWKQSAHEKVQAQVNGRLKHGGSMLKFEVLRDEVDLTYEANPFLCAVERKSEDVEDVKAEDDPEGWVAWRRNWAQGWDDAKSRSDDSWSQEASEESNNLRDCPRMLLESSSACTRTRPMQQKASHEKDQLKRRNESSEGHQGRLAPNVVLPPHLRAKRDSGFQLSSSSAPDALQAQVSCQTRAKTTQSHEDEGVSLLKYADKHNASSDPLEQSPWSLARQLKDCSTPQAKGTGTSWFEVITI